MSTDSERLTLAQAESLTAVSEPWLSCDECFDQIDVYVETLLHAGHGLDEPLRLHLARCPACYEEAESLIALRADDDGLDAGTPLSAFHTDFAKAQGRGRNARSAVRRLLRR